MSTTPPPPQQPAGGPPGVPSSDDRNWAVAAHLSALIGFVGIPTFIGPLIVWLVKRDQPFTNEHGREALNFNLSLLIYVLVAGVIALVTLGLALFVLIPLGIAVFILWLVFLIQGAMQASRGQSYRYPLTIRLIS